MTTSKKLRDMKLPPGYNACLLLDAAAEIDRLTREHDEALAERDALRLAIDRHRRNVWGDLSVRYSDAVRHPEDSSLYAALAQIEKEK